MEGIGRVVNRHTFTAWVTDPAYPAYLSVLVRATRENVEEAVTNEHLDIIFKDIFTGEFEVETLQMDEYALDLKGIESFGPKPFGLFIPPGCGDIIPVEMVNVLPEGWKYDDPCITTYIPTKALSPNDFIMNLRTEEIIFFGYGCSEVTEIKTLVCPSVSGEAQLIFSMFITHSYIYELMMLCKAPAPRDIRWYADLWERWVRYFPEASSIAENKSAFKKAFHSNMMCFSVNDAGFKQLAYENDMHAYIHRELIGIAECSRDHKVELYYHVKNTEENLLYMDKLNMLFALERDCISELSSVLWREAESPKISVTYRDTADSVYRKHGKLD